MKVSKPESEKHTRETVGDGRQKEREKENSRMRRSEIEKKSRTCEQSHSLSAAR